MSQQNIPDFMRGYYEITDSQGHAELERLAKQYEGERSIFLQTTFVAKQQFQRDWNKLTGQRKELTVDEALRPMDDKYKAMAQEIAVRNGYQTDKNEVTHQQDNAEPQQVENKAQQAQNRPNDSGGDQPALSRREQFLQNLSDMRKSREHVHEVKDTGGDQDEKETHSERLYLKVGGDKPVQKIRLRR